MRFRCTRSSFCLIFTVISSFAAPIDTPASGAALLCTLDHPVVLSGGSVKASAVPDSPGNALLQYQWTADAGTFLSGASGQEVEWAAKAVTPGPHVLSVSAEDAEHAKLSCSLRIVVAEPERGAFEPSPMRSLARAFLVRGAMESPNYGLYT